MRMQFKLKCFLFINTFILISGCSTSFSTIKDLDDKYIYQVSESEAFMISQGAILEVLPGRQITNINGQIKGYSTWFRFILDTYTQQVLIYPVKAKSTDNKDVEGYYFEVSGSGSAIIQGRAKNIELWDSIITSLDSTNSRVAVKSFEITGYKSKNPFSSSQTLKTNDSPYGKLEKLKSLHEKGVITDSEYEQKKKELLKEI